MKFIETILNKIIEMIEDKFPSKSLTISGSDTKEEILDRANKMQNDNLNLIKKSILIDKIFKSICMAQTIFLVLVVILYNLFDKSLIIREERNKFMFILYISILGVNHFSSSISLSLYSKTLRNLLNADPNILSRVFVDGLNGYEEVYGEENPDDRDILTMSKIRHICKGMEADKQEAIYLLMKAILINKATKNFIVVSIIAFIIIGISDLTLLITMVLKVYHLDKIFSNLTIGA